MLNFFFSFLGLLTLSISAFADDSKPITHRKFEGQVVIVTGASRGIGRGIAQQFAKEGAKVVLVARDEKRLKEVEETIHHQEQEAFTLQADVSSPRDMQRMVSETIERYGKVDVLCHNAGIYPYVRLEEMTLEEWHSVIETNLTGTFLAIKACIPHMKDQGHGKIVIISSISGPRTALPGYAHYTASKGGIAGFVKTAAVELAKYQITINAIEPGNILTETLSASGPDYINNMLAAIPLGRLGAPEDVAHTASFLASDEASFITGQSVVLDGGQTLPESHFNEY